MVREGASLRLEPARREKRHPGSLQHSEDDAKREKEHSKLKKGKGRGTRRSPTRSMMSPATTAWARSSR